jgi:cell division septum initiation protein DivIVA
MSVIDLIDQLEGLLAGGRRVLFTPTVMVNEEAALDLIDRARMELPDEIKHARWTVENQQRLVAEAEAAASGLREAAQREADAIVAAARAEAERISHEAAARAEQTEVVRAAQARAEATLRGAGEESMRIRTDAEAYARDVMEGLAAHLDRVMTTVQRGLDTLGDRRQGR